MFQPNSILGKLLLRHTDGFDDPSLAALKLKCEVDETISSLRDWKRKQDEDEADFEKSLKVTKGSTAEDEFQFEIPQADMIDLDFDRIRSLKLPILNISENHLSFISIPEISEIETSDLYKLGSDLTQKLSMWQSEVDDLLEIPSEKGKAVWSQLDEIEQELAELEGMCGSNI